MVVLGLKTLIIAAVITLSFCSRGGKVASDRGRIVGGELIRIQEAPYQVSLRQFEFHICGGAIISANHVITAAHCEFSDHLFIFLRHVLLNRYLWQLPGLFVSPCGRHEELRRRRCSQHHRDQEPSQFQSKDFRLRRGNSDTSDTDQIERLVEAAYYFAKHQ